jgi:hypothetical protein
VDNTSTNPTLPTDHARNWNSNLRFDPFTLCNIDRGPVTARAATCCPTANLIFLLQPQRFRRIIARLFVMGGTIAQSLFRLATLSGHLTQQRPEGTLGQHAKAPPHNAPHL